MAATLPPSNWLGPVVTTIGTNELVNNGTLVGSGTLLASVDWSTVLNRPNIAAVSHKFVTSMVDGSLVLGQPAAADVTGLHAVATSGAYADLSGAPALNSVATQTAPVAGLVYSNGTILAAATVGAGATFNAGTLVVTATGTAGAPGAAGPGVSALSLVGGHLIGSLTNGGTTDAGDMAAQVGTSISALTQAGTLTDTMTTVVNDGTNDFKVPLSALKTFFGAIGGSPAVLSVAGPGTVGTNQSFTVSGNLANYATVDASHPVLQYKDGNGSAVSASATITAIGTTAGTFHFTHPGVSSGGTLTVTVLDAGGFASGGVDVVVSSTPAIQLAAISGQPYVAAGQSTGNAVWSANLVSFSSTPTLDVSTNGGTTWGGTIVATNSLSAAGTLSLAAGAGYVLALRNHADTSVVSNGSTFSVEGAAITNTATAGLTGSAANFGTLALTGLSSAVVSLQASGVDVSNVATIGAGSIMLTPSATASGASVVARDSIGQVLANAGTIAITAPAVGVLPTLGTSGAAYKLDLDARAASPFVDQSAAAANNTISNVGTTTVATNAAGVKCFTFDGTSKAIDITGTAAATAFGGTNSAVAFVVYEDGDLSPSHVTALFSAGDGSDTTGWNKRGVLYSNVAGNSTNQVGWDYVSGANTVADGPGYQISSWTAGKLAIAVVIKTSNGTALATRLAHYNPASGGSISTGVSGSGTGTPDAFTKACFGATWTGSHTYWSGSKLHRGVIVKLNAAADLSGFLAGDALAICAALMEGGGGSGNFILPSGY